MRNKKEEVKKEEVKQENKEESNVICPNAIVDYDIAKDIVNLLIDKHMLISAKRGQKILDMAKSMLLDVAHILYK